MFAAPLAKLSGLQSVLAPQGEAAARIADISWVLFSGAAATFAATMAMLAASLFGGPRLRAAMRQRSVIVAGGIVFPVLTLSALLVYTLSAAPLIDKTEPAMRIEVNGELWWWRVRYLDQDGAPLFETANDIRIPVGETIEFLLKSDNVIHSFWVPELAGKLDAIPGRTNRLRVRATAPGVFRGQCAEYCGAQHAKMMFHVTALTARQFGQWLAHQRGPATEANAPALRAAKLYFMRACARCHAIRGTEAAGTLGPDLTHVGSRQSVGAGVLPNNVGAFAGWIAGSQHIKPGNKMPPVGEVSGAQLRALAHYMESLQ